MRLLLASVAFSLNLIGSKAVAAPTADKEVKDVFSAFVKDWSMPGFPGLETITTPDVDFVVVTGEWLKGRDRVVAYHRNLLRTFYAGSHLSVDDIQVRLIDTKHAIVHFASTVHYVQDNKPIARPSLATATLIKSDSGWRIDTFQNTITGGPGYMFNHTPALPNHS